MVQDNFESHHFEQNILFLSFQVKYPHHRCQTALIQQKSISKWEGFVQYIAREQ